MARFGEIKLIQDLQPGKEFTILHVYRLRHPIEKHFILHIWEDDTRLGWYILPLHDYFCQNEIIQTNNGLLLCSVTFQGLGPSGDPVVHFTKNNLQRKIGCIYNTIIPSFSLPYDRFRNYRAR